MKLLNDAITAAIDAAVNHPDPAEAIVDRIYAERASRKKFFFLFNQNLRRTNMQVAELVSLLRIHARCENSPLNYIDITDFAYIKELIAACIKGTPEPFSKGRETIARLIYNICANRILLESYYGSSSVFLPAHIDIDIKLVCGESGYIHSCGHILLLRNATKASASEFDDALDEASNLYKDQNFIVVPYCHEDFTATDRGKSQFYQYGLDDVKLHISKAHVGAARLIDVLENATTAREENFFLAPGGDYKAALSAAREHFGEEAGKTIWVLADAAVTPQSRFPGESKYYAIYLQIFRNHNYYHLFDENKPGWASHTTLPHSLTGAMLNVARPWLPRDTQIRVADPFGGSGTTFLECQKVPGMEVHCSDLAPIYKYVVEDNVNFFKSTPSDLEKVRTRLNFLRTASFSEVVPAKKSRVETLSSKLLRITSVAKTWAEETNYNFLELDNNSLIMGMNEVGNDLSDRLTLYLVLKTLGRSQSEIVRGAAAFEPTFHREVEELIGSCEQYADYVNGRDGPTTCIVGTEVVKGTYSEATIPGQPRESNADLFGSADFEVMDVLKLPESRYDLIITDPPYAFNTDEDITDFSEFVPKMLERLVMALKPAGGQIVMACPAASFSGRPVLPFIRSDFVTREIIRISAKVGRRCVVPAMGLPTITTDVRPPYYWVAEKTLRRRILHFWIEEEA